MAVEFFATTAKGVEEVLANEIRSLGVDDVALEKGGVRFTGTMETCYKANLWLRTANRVLLPIVQFPCESPEDLYEGVRSVAWHQYLGPDNTLAVSCSLRDSKINHSGFAALKAKDAIVDSIRDTCGQRPNVDPKNPDLLVNVHLARNVCTISLDTSAISLDKRGYRIDAKEAPLRETLAAAMIELSGWDGSVPFIDPLCGSGTIAIEAALKALRCPPGMFRREFGFQKWPDFDGQAWQNILAQAQGKVLEQLSAPVLGSDRSSAALEVARKNATRAGVEGFVEFVTADITRCPCPATPGVVVCNPPYGIRLGDAASVKALYKSLGDTLKKRFAGFTAYILTGNPELVSSVGLKASRRIVLFNGPIECRLLRYELY
jgi:putative N6-adenine-specific DNA methylase